MANEYRAGRIFIAGDAAHSHPPYGGFGLNNGLEDVANLGWKLAARLNGWGGEALLRSYDEERRPVFKQIGDEFIAARIAWEGEMINRYDPVREPEAFKENWQKLKTESGPIVLNYEPNYEASPVLFGPPGGVTRARGDYMFKARAGHHLAPRALSSGRNVFEELGDWVCAAGLRGGGQRDCAVRVRRACAPYSAENRPRHLCRAGARTTKRGWCWFVRISMSSGPATKRPPTRMRSCKKLLDEPID